MNEKYRIEEINTYTEKDEVLIKVFDFLDLIFREKEKDDPLPTNEYRMKNFRTESPNWGDNNWAVWEEQKVISFAYFNYRKESSPNFEQNKHLGYFDIKILKQHRRKGIGSEMLKVIIQKAKELGFITTLNVSTSYKSGFEFCKKYNGVVAMESADNRLKFEDVNWDLMNEWIEQGRVKGEQEGRTLQWFEKCPEDILEEFCEVYTETMNQQPFGEIEHRPLITPESRRATEDLQAKRDYIWQTVITREKDGKISGITDVTYIPAMPHRIYQELTGVLNQYRGNGLGKWLKAEMLHFVHKKYPEAKYIRTGNADANAPMLSINNRMGFKLYKKVIDYKFKIDELEMRVNKK